MKEIPMRYVRRSVLFTALAAAAPAAIAQQTTAAPVAIAQEPIPDHPALRDKFYFTLGAYFPRTTTSAELESHTGVGANIDFENTLGMKESKSVPMAMARWRTGERWRIEAEYFQLNRTGDKTIDRTINWGDQTFPVNSTVSSKFNFSDLRLSAGYSFFKTKDKEVGVGLGVHAAAYDANLSGTVNGAPIGGESEKVTAPLPVLSVYGQFALTDRWAVAGRMDRFALKYGKYSGNLTGIGLDVMYQPFKNVGFGLGSRALALKVSAEDAGRKAEFKQTFQGPTLFVSASF
jgi:hypothetical protein